MYAKNAEDLSIQFVGEAGSAKPAGQLRVLSYKSRVGLLRCSGFQRFLLLLRVLVGLLSEGSLVVTFGGCFVWLFPLIVTCDLGSGIRLDSGGIILLAVFAVSVMVCLSFFGVFRERMRQ